jgi:hypothetical protein
MHVNSDNLVFYPLKDNFQLDRNLILTSPKNLLILGLLFKLV